MYCAAVFMLLLSFWQKENAGLKQRNEVNLFLRSSSPGSSHSNPCDSKFRTEAWISTRHILLPGLASFAKAAKA
ncbi:hypothetical protein JOM56_012767 [Amanita muscaria]